MIPDALLTREFSFISFQEQTEFSQTLLERVFK